MTATKRHAPSRTIVISDAELVERRIAVDDAVLTGRQIARFVSGSAPDEKVVLLRGRSGGLKELGEDEEVSVDETAYFWVVESDRTFRFEIDGIDSVWPSGTVAGRILYAIGRIDPATTTLLLDRTNAPDQEVSTDTVIDLSAPGFERFRTRLRQQGVRIYVNDVAHTVLQASLSGAQIMALGGIESDYQLFLEQEGDDKPIDAAASVRLVDDMRFYALPRATFG